MTNEIIRERINTLDPSYRAFVLSNSPSQITEALAKVHGFDEDKYIVFENGFAMFLLFFISKSDLTNYLISDCGLKLQDAKLLTEALILALPPEIRIMQESTSQLIFNRAETDQNDISKDIAEAEAVLNAIEPIRTTSTITPIDQDKTYTSTQSAILNEKMQGEGSPDTVRWGNN
ncbi:MAG: hypothetical protein KBC78_01225 [Candidatus Pacebacteria bacterium]|nr:hypothetical protein [Candidatus Paceibacterota bacterium]